MPSLFLTVFIDMLGVGIIIPILAPIMLDPSFGMLAEGASGAQRNIAIGFLIATYPIMQFFGAPVLGALSDKHGRKRILAISLIGTLAGYLLFAYAIYIRSIELLFISRALDGFTGGNIAIAMSAISDISTPESKARNFGMVGAAFGFGFVIGPYIGGKLADPAIISWFDAGTPLLFAALLTLVNILLVFFRLPETLSHPRHSEISLTTGIRNVVRAFASRQTRTVFIVVFLIALGFTFFTQFFQVFLFHKYDYTISEIADVFAYVGIWIVIAQGALMRPLSRRFKAHQMLRVTPLLLSLALFMIVVPDKTAYLLCVIPFVSLSQGLTLPNANTLVSNSVPPDRQGEILGINQSVSSFAMSIPPIMAAYLTNIDIHLPTITASVLIFLAWLVYMVFYRPSA
ncbi:MAG: MFS transporter [Bacteroidota bacterium]